jgi:glycosyltransferase involved in cell wall biosynthesis
VSKPDTVVLCGPLPDLGPSAYGGGKGGYVRNVTALLGHFASGGPHMILSPYSARHSSPFWRVLLPLRLAADLGGFARHVRSGGVVHLMMTYGLAIYREFGIAVMAAVCDRPLVLDIRGGSFVPWLESTTGLHRAMAHWILRNAAVILAQGLAVVRYLQPRYGTKVHHFPNFIEAVYVPSTVPDRCLQPELAIAFVGYCYAGKGVFELIDAVVMAVMRGVRIHLTLIGAESPDFKANLDRRVLPKGLVLERCGTLDFPQVQRRLEQQDILCLPTRHAGEGHPNVITEAMAHGLVIVTTCHGFIPELLDPTAAYFVDPMTAENLAEVLVGIDGHRDDARQKARRVRAILEERYTEARVLGGLRELYRHAFRHSRRTPG